ncbi:MAG: T9SS type A sorting domain-containing protein [Bacteroidales bacterium]|nr:T9SS type A sorting domain-containing protein [Bacteroidales bacterium]
MKKLLSIIIAVMFGFGLNAQTSLTQAPDFTTTDYFGNEINLYEILEGGQHVLLHFNTRTNEATPEVTPPLVEAYKKLGCNQHDVFFIGVVPNGTTSITKKYVEEYGIEFPMILNTDESNGMEGDAFDITRELYQVWEYPTTLLIAPDKSIALQDISPMKEANDIISALTPFGIKEYECGNDEGEDETPEELTPMVEITVTDVTTTTVDVSFNPAGECASYYILLDTEAAMEQWTTVFGVSLEQLIEEWSIERQGPSTHLWDELVPNTEYTIFVLSKDIEGEVLQIDKQKVTTEVLGGNGVSVVDLQVEVTSNTSVFVTATPNEETAEYHYILIEKSYADSIGVDSTMQILYTDPYALYEIDRWEWIDLNENTEFYAIAQGKNAQGEWGEITKVEFVTTTEGNIELVENNFNIYPNPVNDRLYIETQTLTQTIEIYDVYGRIQNLSNSATQQLINSINVANLNSGVYFVKVVTANGEVVKRFVKK